MQVARDPRRIFVVEDDPDVRGFIVTLLHREGYVVAEAGDAVGAMDRLTADPPDLVLLDIGLPGAVDGLDLLQQIRSSSTVPIIMLTGRAEEEDRIDGLRSGADDYVAKPFSPGELMARVDSVLRRSALASAGAPDAQSPVLRFEGIEIDPAAREVRVEGVTAPVTAREFDLLAFLAATPRRTFTREELLQQVWDSSIEWQGGATVTEHVRRLRRKIETDPDHPRRVVTVRGVGYRFEP